MMTTNGLNSVFDHMLSLSRAMEQSLGSDGELGWSRNAGSRAQVWLPALDAYETENAFVVEADLPGVHPENVEISFEANTLTLRGTRAPTLQAPEKSEFRVYTAERAYGNFARAIRLPDYVEGDKIEAQYTNGTLTITVPKTQAAKPRKIAIKSGVESKRLNA